MSTRTDCGRLAPRQGIEKYNGLKTVKQKMLHDSRNSTKNLKIHMLYTNTQPICEILRLHIKLGIEKWEKQVVTAY